MKKLLAMLITGVALVACSNNESSSSNNANSSAPAAEASAPAADASAAK
ncbi:MAG: hypothetical protein ORN24_06590 [Burkholderiales bacterium]|nr:hypothetical protein [Burkholderiales bacterium]